MPGSQQKELSSETVCAVGYRAGLEAPTPPSPPPVLVCSRFRDVPPGFCFAADGLVHAA